MGLIKAKIYTLSPLIPAKQGALLTDKALPNALSPLTPRNIEPTYQLTSPNPANQLKVETH